MEKVSQPLEKNYLPVKLYLDDLRAIEETLIEVSARPNIEAGGYRFASLEELTMEIGNHDIAEMEISSSGPHVTIELTRKWARLYVGSSEATSAGLFFKLDEILKHARRRLWFLYSYYLQTVFNMVFIVTWFFHSSIGDLPSKFTLGVWAMWVLWVLVVRLHHHSVIILSSRNAKGSFWIRKKDDIIMLVIGVALGVLGSWVANYFGK